MCDAAAAFYVNTDDTFLVLLQGFCGAQVGL